MPKKNDSDQMLDQWNLAAMEKGLRAFNARGYGSHECAASPSRASICGWSRDTLKPADT